MKKTILITGATDGIGKQTALELADRGYHVIVHGRSEAKCLQTIDGIRRHVPSAHLDHCAGDLSSMASVRSLAEQILRKYDALHVLINNAGVFMKERVLTVDGFEMTFAVNHLAPFLLTMLLLDRLKASAPSRIITVSSVAHSRGKIDLEDLPANPKFGGYAAYAMSKLANILFTAELAERLNGTNVTANTLHPGVIRTKLLVTGFGAMDGNESLAEGAATSVFLATDDSVTSVSGEYFVKQKRASVAPAARDGKMQKGLWELSERLTVSV